MRAVRFIIFSFLISAFGASGPAAAQLDLRTLSEARKDFKTKLIRQERGGQPAVTAPPAVFRTVRYDSPAGKLAAYVTPDPKDGKKHPAIIWITGGDCNSIDAVWENAPPANDQTAAQYRKAGIVMMFPSLRGGNDNPGVKEGFLGEVDDVIAAAKYVRSLPYVDPARVYLGGHSTGGTLVLLVAEMTDGFRAVFSFGPVSDVRSYRGAFVSADVKDAQEMQLRSPGYWLVSIKSPVFVIEGSGSPNIGDLNEMKASAKGVPVQFLTAKGATHFNVLAPVNGLIAGKIIADTGAPGSLALTEDEVSRALGKYRAVGK